MIRMLAIFGFLILCAPGAQAQDRGLVRSISVSGQCLRSVVPDRGSIIVTVDHQDQNVQVATKKTTEAYEALKKAVQKLALKNVELQTSEYNVQEVREWEKNRTVSKGFRARMGLEVTTSEIARLGEVIAAAANAKITDVGALRSFLSDVKNREEREACLEEAIGHAQAKAAKMAKAAGAKLGRVLQLKEEGSSMNPVPQPMAEARFMAKSSMMDSSVAAPAIDSTTQKLSLSVEALYALD